MKWRTWHAYVGLAAALPLLLIVVTGLCLQLRNQFESLQPKIVAMKVEEGKPYLTMEEVLSRFEKNQVEQIIFRPGKSNFAVRIKGGNEVQLHPQTGEVIKNLPRRAGVLIDIHQGSWMGPVGQYGVHFAAGVGLLFLLISGILLFPWKKWKRV